MVKVKQKKQLHTESFDIFYEVIVCTFYADKIVYYIYINKHFKAKNIMEDF